MVKYGITLEFKVNKTWITFHLINPQVYYYSFPQVKF